MAKSRRYPELSALKGRIREKGSSYRELASAIGMSLNAFSDKINGFYVFSLSEAESIADYLDIGLADMGYIFFPTMLKTSAKSGQKLVSGLDLLA